ncbi:DUF4179 domain-containing protein [Paenibacillus sp. FSL W8-0187]|uniref:DUF4179 domain-containing protein n=1 Tax=unclassified Paenibacillus TaxID=185978 RepID=UPI0030D7F2D1
MIEQQIQNAKRSYESMETDVDRLMERVRHSVASEDRSERTTGMLHKNRSQRIVRRLLLTAVGTLTACAVILGSGFVFPVMASVLQEIPFVGSVFQYVRDIGLKTASEKGMTAQLEQSVNDNGITLQIQEVMYDGDRLSIGYIQQVEDGFFDMGGPTNGIKFKIDGKPYADSVGASGPQAIDSKTGVGQISLQPFKQKLPDEFELTIEVAAVGGVKGHWDFSIPVKKTVSGMKSWMPMMSATDGETTLLIKKIGIKPGTGTMDVELEYRRPAAKAQDPMYDIQAITDTGIELEYYAMVGDGYVKDDTHIQLGTFQFEVPLVTPKSITLRPYLRGDVPVYGIRVPMNHEPSTDHPLIIPQGELGRLLVTKVERLKDKTMVHYRKEVIDPLQQTGLIIEDLEGKYNFFPWDMYIIPSEETETKLVDAQNNDYVTEFPALNPDQQPVFVTHEYKNPIFPKELEMTIPIQ